MDAEESIEHKAQSLTQKQFDLGSPPGPLEPLGYGGVRRRYPNATIYWHAQVGCHVVYGGILDAYLARGGHDVNPASGARELGFPIGDEEDAWDGFNRMSRFETGVILWMPSRRNPAVTIHGPAWKRFEPLQNDRVRHQKTAQRIAVINGVVDLDAPVDRLVPVPMGYPLTDTLRVEDGFATYFDRGAWYEGAASSGALFEVDVWAPSIGRPAIVAPEQALPIFLRYSGGDTRLGLVLALYGHRLVLEPVAKPGAARVAVALELVPANEEVAREARESFVAFDRLHGRKVDDASFVRVTLPAGVTLDDATLYDLVLVTADDRRHRLAPHCLYHKRDWSRFGLVHATDIHVNHRSDQFFAQLANSPESRRLYRNFNDSLRALIQYVNHEHDAGRIHAICATGDLVDYGYEKGANRNFGGNFALFRDILLGASPSPDETGPIAQELRVPIFTVPGNHDYRPNPYELSFAAVALGAEVFTKDQFSEHNLTKDDVEVVQGRARIQVSDSDAFAMLAIDRPNEPYHSLLCDLGSYIVRLGRHRLVMLDSRWDTGRILDYGDAFRKVLGWLDDKERSLTGGDPPLDGVHAEEVALLRQALGEAGADGLVVVGLHGPLFNFEGNEFAHYFRETQPTGEDYTNEIIGYLMRHPEGDVVPFQMMPTTFQPLWVWDAVAGKAHYAAWFRRDAAQKHFYEGNLSDRLNFGCTRGEAEKVLGLVAGVGASRPVDVVLFGHGHRNVEFRVEARAAGGFRFFHDYYTMNPGEYYPTTMLAEHFVLKEHVMQNAPYMAEVASSRRKVRVVVRERPVDVAVAPVQNVNAETGNFWRVEVNPYPDMLGDASDKRGWWAHHRPLLMQTAGLGPIESSQRTPSLERHPTFNGIRVIHVVDDVIQSIEYVKGERLRAPFVEVLPMTTATVMRRPR